eukprot:GHVU01082967.1.p1 GENE.GHVU01082967.1~~GHVU01082967.1.p1  ORF type:complete len:112 (+),score=11.50 GHVU01082967.1:187-522(+)
MPIDLRIAGLRTGDIRMDEKVDVREGMYQPRSMELTEADVVSLQTRLVRNNDRSTYFPHQDTSHTQNNTGRIYRNSAKLIRPRRYQTPTPKIRSSPSEQQRQNTWLSRQKS